MTLSLKDFSLLGHMDELRKEAEKEKQILFKVAGYVGWEELINKEIITYSQLDRFIHLIANEDDLLVNKRWRSYIKEKNKV